MKLTASAFKQFLYFIPALSLPYSVILIFSAYGPALHYISGPTQNLFYSSIFLGILLVSMIIPTPGILGEKIRNRLLYILILFSAGTLALFSISPVPVQFGTILLLGFTEGRIAVRWSRIFNETESGLNRIIIISAALCMAYFLLYLSNMLFPSFSPALISLVCAIFFAGAIPFLRRISAGETKASAAGSALTRRSAMTIYLVIFVIYLTAGFTYTIIFPEMRNYGRIDRFYNVLPFVLTIPVAGFLVRKTGMKHLLSIGIALLGISYIFYQLPPTTSRYFLVESFIQPGWAFIDLLVWLLGSHLAKKTGQSRYIPVCVAVFLGGTLVGAVLSIFFIRLELHQYQSIIFLSLSLLPLFLVIPIVNRLEMDEDSRSDETVPLIPEDLLTSREYQIALLLIENNTQKEICGEIHISINTLKTHTRNIYRKLGVKNKKELQRINS